MALVALDSIDEQVVLDKVVFNEAEKEFILNFGQDEVILKYPINLSKEHNPDNFSLYLFSNISLNAENDIFQIVEVALDKRIGWIFPLQSILSNLHKKSQDKYFLNYAFIAYNLLLKGDQSTFCNKPKISDLLNACSLEDFYPENIVVLIISKDALAQPESFDINNYLPSLCNFGYFKYSINSKKISEDSSSISAYYHIYRGNEKIRIKCISNKYISNPFIQELYENLLFSSRHHLLIFHYLYQVVEFLIDENFKIEFDKLLVEFQSNNLSRLDFREELSNSLNEKKRINKINELVKPNNEICTDLLQECNRLLVIIDKTKTTYVEALYKVRSLLVHEYRKISSRPDLIEIVENINLRFEHLISEILNNDLE